MQVSNNGLTAEQLTERLLRQHSVADQYRVYSESTADTILSDQLNAGELSLFNMGSQRVTVLTMLKALNKARRMRESSSNSLSSILNPRGRESSIPAAGIPLFLMLYSVFTGVDVAVRAAFTSEASADEVLAKIREDEVGAKPGPFSLIDDIPYVEKSDEVGQNAMMTLALDLMAQGGLLKKRDHPRRHRDRLEDKMDREYPAQYSLTHAGKDILRMSAMHGL